MPRVSMMFSAFEYFERKDVGLDEDALDAASAWQDVLDLVAAGRPGDLACPFCRYRPLAVEDVSESHSARISCSKCGKFIEVGFNREW